ncbi:MAG TPA: hypothetical protein VK742_15575 [Candidatus Sulfotelmatobacter sp.]|nr:hypothetical protein [Candidatus Sulfotelmatobacter sp.]
MKRELELRLDGFRPLPTKIKSHAEPMTQTEAIAKLESIFGTVFLEPAVGKASNLRFRIGKVENAKNVGEFADLIIKRQQEP